MNKVICALVLVVLSLLPTNLCASEILLLAEKGTAKAEIEKALEEKLDSLVLKRMDLPLVRTKLKKVSKGFSPVYGSVINHGDKRYEDFVGEEDLFDAESLFVVLNNQVMQKNEMLLKKAPLDIQKEYKHLLNRFNFVSLERIKIHVEYYYDALNRRWVRPSAGDSVVSMMMFFRSGYFLHQDSDSIISIRRYGYYIPGSSVKRIFFDDGYSEILRESPNDASPDLLKVLPYKLVEKISQDKSIDTRQKIKNLLKRRDFSAIPIVLKEMDELCESSSCDDSVAYKRYLAMLMILYAGGLLSHY